MTVEKKEMIKNVLSCLGTSSVKVMIGGITAAVVPPGVSFLYKAATYIGGVAVAMATTKPIQNAVSDHIDEIEWAINEIKNDIYCETREGEGA